MYLICTSSVWSISFVSSNIKGVVAVFCIEAWRVTSAIICQMWPLPIFLFQINSCQEFCSFLPIDVLNSRVQVRLLNVIERSCPIIWRPMVWHQSESSVYVPPLNRTAAAERRLTSGIPLTSGEDVQVPEWPPRHIHFTLLCAPESKMVFDEIGFPQIWQNLNSDMKLDSLIIIFFSSQFFTPSSSDDDADVGVRVDSDR